MREENKICPVCANKCGHLLVDSDKNAYQCDICMGIHNFTERLG
jgi:hypothetical protein